MAAEQDEKSLLMVNDFLSSGHVFVLDYPKSSRQILCSILKNFGTQENQIHEYDSIPEALNEYKKWNPVIILSDYRLKDKTGFDFFRECKELDGGRSRAIFIIVTANLMQSVVSKAAEEEIDAYIIRPFSKEVFYNVLKDAIKYKNFPTEYMKKINAGKEHLIDKRYDLAMECFEDAMSLDEKPSLACAYYANVKRIFKSDDLAVEKYLQGLEYNNIHYRCLRGLYDLFMSHQRYEEAYEMAKQITRYFPTSENILSSVIRLAIITKNLEDMESFYAAFKGIDFHNEILQKYICAGMYVTGKYFLKHGDYEKGLDLFEKISKVYGGKTNFLRAIIETLLENDYYFLAYKYFGLFDIKEKFSKDYLICSVLVNYYNDSSKEDVLPKALELINQKVDSRPLFRKTLSHLNQMGEEETFHQVMKKANEIWPSFIFNE